MKKAAAVYSIFVGIAIIGMWTMTLLTGGETEGTTEITFHLISEFSMAILLLVSGIALLKGKEYGKKIFLIANGMLIYSVLNAAGYYGQRGNMPMLCMFMVLCGLSVVSLVFSHWEKG